jgi:hypothetical protein
VPTIVKNEEREGIMKKVHIAAPVEIALRTLDEDNRRRAQAWFDHLANWDGDPFVRTHSHSLESVPGVYVLKTSTELRIFFTMKGNTITVIDLGTKQSILTSGHISGAE